MAALTSEDDASRSLVGFRAFSLGNFLKERLTSILVEEEME